MIVGDDNDLYRLAEEVESLGLSEQIILPKIPGRTKYLVTVPEELVKAIAEYCAIARLGVATV